MAKISHIREHFIKVTPCDDGDYRSKYFLFHDRVFERNAREDSWLDSKSRAISSATKCNTCFRSVVVNKTAYSIKVMFVNHMGIVVALQNALSVVLQQIRC